MRFVKADCVVWRRLTFTRSATNLSSDPARIANNRSNEGRNHGEDDGKFPLRLHRSFFFRAISRTSVAAPMAAVADDLDIILKHTDCEHN